MYSDSNIHLPETATFEDDLHFDRLSDKQRHIDSLRDELRVHGVSSGNIMVFDSDFANQVDTASLAKVAPGSVVCTALFDPRLGNIEQRVGDLAARGFRGIKFHPYFQNLADHDFFSALGAVKAAQDNGMWLMLCCSYGTKRVFENRAVRLLGAIAQAEFTLPVVALHSGGRLALEVMSIALDAPNIYLDTSFSIPFWNGSSVETDLAFAFKKIGYRRVLFGSDRPYQPLDTAIKETERFLERHKFSSVEVDAIMSANFQEFIGYGR